MRSASISIIQATAIGAALLLFDVAAQAEDRNMVLEGIDGDVTTNEWKAFIDKLHYLPPPPSNNVGNLMVDERDGARIHGMQTFYEFTHDRRDLDMAIVWSDAFLHARNDPTNGRIMWTGKRDLCWPNKATNDQAYALYSGTENGDVIEHIVNTARLILENPSVWAEEAPADTYSFGKTYLDRAKTYVNECQRSAETTIIPWYVRKTKDGYRLHHPDSTAYYKYCESSGPVPWNQQQSITGGLLRLAQCHRLLNDDNTNIAYYEKITADAADWFFASALPVSAHGRVCYQWTYVAPQDPADWPEVTTESDYDMFIFRAFQANLGPTRLQIQRLINTARFVMYLGTNRISGKVDGTSTAERHDRQFLEFEWIEMSVLDRDFYHLVADTVLTSHEYGNNVAVEAAVLSAKHFWATHAPSPEPQETLDPAKLPPVNRQLPPFLALIRRHTPAAGRTPAALLLLLWIVSGLGRIVAQRFDSSAAGRDPWSGTITRIYLIVVALGIFAALRFPAAAVSWPGIVAPTAVSLLVLGLALQWYAFIQTAVLAKANAAGPTKDRVAAPYHSIGRLGYVGGLLAIIGLSLSFRNWASLVIMCAPSCAVVLWRRYGPAGYRLKEAKRGAKFLLCLAIAWGWSRIAGAETHGGLTEYVIQPGDTLSQIAEKHGVATLIVQQVNRIKNSDGIQEGATLVIPSLDWIAEKFLADGEEVIPGNVRIGWLQKTNLLVGIDVKSTNHVRFIAVTLSGTNRVLMFDSYKFPDMIDCVPHYAFLDLDGDGDSDIISDEENGSGCFLRMNAFHFDEKAYHEHHLAGEIAIGFFKPQRKKNGFAVINIYERYTGRLVVVDWETARNLPPDKPVVTGGGD